MPTTDTAPTDAALKPVPAPLIGSYLLESITTGMYGERRNALREYVQNSFDGIRAAIDAGQYPEADGKVALTLAADRSSLVIFDNGAGLSHRIAVNTLTAVGASRKQRGQQAGFRGIGRLAGIAFTKTLRFRTKAAGEPLETVVQFDCEQLRRGMLSSGRRPAHELIAACTTFDQRTVQNVAESFFEVSLIGLQGAPVEAVDPLQLRTYLSQVAPVDYDPEFVGLKDEILDQAAALEVPEATANAGQSNEAPADDVTPLGAADWSILQDEAASLLDRIPILTIKVVVRSGDPIKEEAVYKPYRTKLALEESTGVPLTSVDVHTGASGAWWGWIGHKAKPGEYQNAAVAGLRFRLKNIQIDGSELITLTPTTNEIRQPFSRWSNWFVGEIHIDPRAVVPNARRDNFEEDERWLAIRGEISALCKAMTTEARRVSKNHQTSLEVLEKKASSLRDAFTTVARAKTFDVKKAQKVVQDSEKLQKDVEKAMGGAAANVQLGLKTISKEIAQIRVGLLEQPQTPEYDKYRDALRRELLDKVYGVLNDYLDIDLYDEVRDAIEAKVR